MSVRRKSIQRKGAEEARNQLPALIAAAEAGQTTIITRHGRSVAALGPVERRIGVPQKGLVSLAGSGKGLWGARSSTVIRRLRDEWER